MKRAGKGTRVCLGAWGISVGFHALLLGVFAGVRLHSAGAEVAPDSAAFVSLDQVRRVIEAEPVTAKPKLRPIVFESPRPELPESERAPDAADLPQTESPAWVLSDELIRSSVNFFGSRSRAERICFVVDCSASMFGRMGLVRRQLREAVEKLNPDQFFSVLFYLDGQTLVESGSGFLQRASAVSKQKALELIESVLPKGQTEPLGALRKAMGLRTPGGQAPDVIYFLTDGFELDASGAVLFAGQVEKMRKELAPRTAIHTIGFWMEPEDRLILEMLASESGGRFISVESGQDG